MTPRTLALLLAAALSAVPAGAQRVELVPESVVPSAPGASAVSAAPTATLAPSLAPSALAASAPLSLAPVPVAAAAAPAALAIAAAPAAMATAAPALNLAPAPAAGVAPALAASGKRAARGVSAAGSIETLAPGTAGGLDGAVRFDGAKERAGSSFSVPSAPISEERAPSSLKPALRTAKKATGDAERMASTIPSWMREELPVTAAKLGRELPPDYAADVLARSNVWVYKWHSRWTYEISGGLPDGHFDPKFGIRVMLKADWRKLKDPETHFRVLFAHEYTHWLQEEGLVTRRYGGEIPAVAVEQLRALELVGWEGMKEGRVGFIAEGNLQSFEHGREWARGDMKDETQLYFRGVLGGAAYEVGRIAGRPEAAWEFLNLVIAEKGGLKPREAFERVTGRAK